MFFKNLLKAHPVGKFWQGFWKHIFTVPFIAVGVVLFLLTSLFKHSWGFQYLAYHSEDVLQQNLPAEPAKYTSIVAVTPDDYKIDLHSMCMTPDMLSDLIADLKKWSPAVIVVDFDTEPEEFGKLVAKFNPKDHSMPIVWARDARERGEGRERSLEPVPFLGGKAEGTCEHPVVALLTGRETHRCGYPVYAQTPDWTVRTYQRTLSVNGHQAEDTLHWAAVKAFCATPAGNTNLECGSVRAEAEPAKHNEKEVPLRGARHKFLIVHSGDIKSKKSELAADNPLANRIVLLGGTYSANDRHATPWGSITGVELLANAVESELSVERGSEFENVLADVLLSLLIAFFHYSLKPRPAMLAVILFLGGVLFFGSFIVLWYAGYRTGWVIFILGIWIEQLWDGADSEHESSESKPSNMRKSSRGPQARLRRSEMRSGWNRS